jgi:hypothetical protein
MRAQPVLTGKSLFGPVAEKIKTLQEEQRSRRKDDAVISIKNTQYRPHPYKQTSSSQKSRGRNDSSYSSFDRSKPKRPVNKTYSQPDYTSSALKMDDFKGKKSSRGQPFSRGGQGKKPEVTPSSFHHFHPVSPFSQKVKSHFQLEED